MKKRTTQSFAVMCAMALSGVAWAQSNTDLPALPQDLNGGEAPMPSVELPAPALAPAQQIAEPALPPVTEAPASQAGMEMPTLPPASAAPAEVPAVPISEVAAPIPAAPSGFKPSYGEFENSLMYSAQDIDRMKKVLYGYERLQQQTDGIAVKDEFTDLLVEVKPVVAIQEPAKYPSYYLSSIVYRSPKDWIFWLNKEKVTPKHPVADLKIISVSDRSVTFLWQPEYLSAVKMRAEKDLLSTALPNHFRVSSAKIEPNDVDKGVRFTLAPNQTFVGAALGVFEGKHWQYAPPKMEQEMHFDDSAALPQEGMMTGATTTPPTAEDQLRATTQELQDFNRNLTRLTPKNNAAGGNSPTITPVIPSTATPNMQPPIPAPPANTTN